MSTEHEKTAKTGETHTPKDRSSEEGIVPPSTPVPDSLKQEKKDSGYGKTQSNSNTEYSRTNSVDISNVGSDDGDSLSSVQVSNVQNRSRQLPDSAVAEGMTPSLLSQQGNIENVPPTDSLPSRPSVGSQGEIDVPDDGDVCPLTDPTVAEESGPLLLSGDVQNYDQDSDDIPSGDDVYDTGQLPLTDPMVAKETSDHHDSKEIEFTSDTEETKKIVSKYTQERHEYMSPLQEKGPTTRHPCC